MTPDSSARDSWVRPRSIRRLRIVDPTRVLCRAHASTLIGSFWFGRVGTHQVPAQPTGKSALLVVHSAFRNEWGTVRPACTCGADQLAGSGGRDTHHEPQMGSS